MKSMRDLSTPSASVLYMTDVSPMRSSEHGNHPTSSMARCNSGHQQKRQHSNSHDRCDARGMTDNKRRIAEADRIYSTGVEASSSSPFLDGVTPPLPDHAFSPEYAPTTWSRNKRAAAHVAENNSIQQQQEAQKTPDPPESSLPANCASSPSNDNHNEQHQDQEESQDMQQSYSPDKDDGEKSSEKSDGNEKGGKEPDENDNSQTSNISGKQTSQALVQKLQDIYRNIVKQEVILQERCSQLTTSQTTELKNLWMIYKVNADLINNYVAFITTALLPSQPEHDLLMGQEIVEIYRIERRLWVYGTITFLDVLKNFSDFMDPEVCCQFITHVFVSISNMLGDMSPKYATPWLERLGDLSRMAIALYPSGFIDWKLSAEYWYTQAMTHIYGHGKLYYHMSTVQQNTLEAFVNLGKSVFCQDTFIPSQQYMQLVIDNIYQRAFAERSCGNNRNSLIVEYLKHSEVMLLSSFLESPELQKVVLTFFEEKFGQLSNGSNFFEHQDMFIQDGEKIKYYFQHAPAFAESHILQLCGFGEPKNPFALLFELPKYLKERKERKERRKSKASNSLTSSGTLPPTSPADFLQNVDSPRYTYVFPETLAIWEESISHVNLTSMQCSISVMKKFMSGPLVVAVPHMLPWAYFLLSLALKISEVTDLKIRSFWLSFVRRVFPWNSLVNFINTLMAVVLDNDSRITPIDTLCDQFDSVNIYTLIDHFAKNEDLPEVWKCWGSLWFDVIADKSKVDGDGTMSSVGVKDHMFLDSPVDGICFDEDDEIGVKFWKRACRLIFIFKGLAREFPFFGLVLAPKALSVRRQISPDHPLQRFCFKFLEGEDNTREYESLSNLILLSEPISECNKDFDALPEESMIKGQSVFDFQGYRRLQSDYTCYNKNGDMITCSLYTSGPLERSAIQGGDDFNSDFTTIREGIFEPEEEPNQLQAMEREWLDTCMDPEFIIQTYDVKFPFGDLSCYCDSAVTYFVLDATSWLRHFAHVYKLAKHGVLKFAICLTTFQELRFLRKSKDESVVEAATRAVITVRQLYSEKKLLPLRFTGNIATHLEEHLEFEEQITWRSHVDEFVIEAVNKAQTKFESLNTQAENEGRDYITSHPNNPFHFVALVTDDTNMRVKAHSQRIQTSSSRFLFAVSNQIGLAHHACTN
ncbi:LAMI_0H00782g1_1 [Lachancea mirantina]|uniref:LAMI_0H00782g1_1 n=1 Tax=Lachancea mirantina TaxID=1230905 RepID=A0A1G4KDI6_9SACH|nr:LAMI_0H00782g1_1 [Lachancea mirantina]